MNGAWQMGPVIAIDLGRAHLAQALIRRRLFVFTTDKEFDSAKP